MREITTPPPHLLKSRANQTEHYYRINPTLIEDAAMLKMPPSAANIPLADISRVSEGIVTRPI